MRGTVLIVDREGALRADVDALRERGLIVAHCAGLGEATAQLERIAPDVVVLAIPADAAAAVVADLRGMLDHATSIIVAAWPGERDAARRACADACLPASAPLADLVDRMHRALILRRSGRRLPWT